MASFRIGMDGIEDPLDAFMASLSETKQEAFIGRDEKQQRRFFETENGITGRRFLGVADTPLDRAAPEPYPWRGEFEQRLESCQGTLRNSRLSHQLDFGEDGQETPATSALWRSTAGNSASARDAASLVGAHQQPILAENSVHATTKQPGEVVSKSAPEPSCYLIEQNDTWQKVQLASSESAWTRTSESVDAEQVASVQTRPWQALDATYQDLVSRTSESVDAEQVASVQTRPWQALDATYQDLVSGSREPGVAPLRNWEETGLPSSILDWLEDGLQMKQPTVVQRACIPVLFQGHHCIGVAETGSGKTLAYLIPLIRCLFRSEKYQEGVRASPTAVVITPTRELAIQVHQVITTLLQRLDWSVTRSISTRNNGRRSIQKGRVRAAERCLCAYGGADMAANITGLCRGVRVLIGTPGRVISLLQMNKGRLLSLQTTSLIVLDEVDRLLDMGFAPQIHRILERASADVQMALFSATLPAAMERLVRKLVLQHSPKMSLRRLILVRCGISVSTIPQIPHTIDQRLEVLPSAEAMNASADHDDAARFAALLDILRWHTNTRMLVFVSRQEQVDLLFQRLDRWYHDQQKDAHLDASALAPYASIENMLALHGGIDQSDRDDTWQSFRSAAAAAAAKETTDHRRDATCRLLIATSLAARGLDVFDLGVVVNYHPPRSLEDYIHRIGRTGRANRAGVAYTLFMPQRDDRVAPFLRQCFEAAGKSVPDVLLAACQRLLTSRAQGRRRSQSNEPSVRASNPKTVAKDEPVFSEMNDCHRASSKGALVASRIAAEHSTPPNEMEPSAMPSAKDVFTRSVTDKTSPDPKHTAQGEHSSTSTVATGPRAADHALKGEHSARPISLGDRGRSIWPSEYRGRGFAFDQRDRERQYRRLLPGTLDPEDPYSENISVTIPSDGLSEHARVPVVFSEPNIAMVPINDYSAAVRQRITRSTFLSRILDRHGCRVLVKGNFQRPTTKTLKSFLEMTEAQRPLYLRLEAPTAPSIHAALEEIRHEIDEQQQASTGSAGYKRYQVP
jgi:superfamily II DNA/RNA helicase